MVLILAFASSLGALTLGWLLAAEKRSSSVLRTRLLAHQAATDAERTHLSHELHDDVGQKLIALKLQLQLSRLPGATSVATHAESVALVDTLIGDVRALSHETRPAPFDEGQLVPALTALVKNEGARAGLCVLVDAPSDDVTVSRDAELACYRVAREALTNIVKHARARHVAVTVRCDEAHLDVTVFDDGRGFDVKQVTRRAVDGGRLGLVGMHERLEQLGGRLDIRSAIGTGTTVACRVPLGGLA